MTGANEAGNVHLLIVDDPDLALSDGLAMNRWSQLTLTDRAALDPGTYTLRAVVGYGNDPLNGAAGDGGGSFVLVSPPATVVVS
ncbi:MAG: hypothetical protein M3Y71_08220 [Actinomycetota bacterium]|nr:hypothetical protein [Actinomycetota bacterium]